MTDDLPMLATVPTGTPGVECRAVRAVIHRCPFVDEVDKGRLTVQWRTTEVTVELHSLAAYLDDWADVAISHENLVDFVLDDLTDTGVEAVAVTWLGVTAGIEVQARAVLRQSVHPSNP